MQLTLNPKACLGFRVLPESYAPSPWKHRTSGGARA